MGHESLAARRPETDKPRPRAPEPVDARLQLAQSLGNARFAALMAVRAPRATLARVLQDPLPLSLGAVGAITVGVVRQYRTTIHTGWHAMMTDEIQVSFVDDLNAVQDLITAADDAFTLLETAARGVNQGDPDSASLSKLDAGNKTGPLGQHVYDVVSNLSGAAKLINRAHREWKKNTQVAVEEPGWAKFEKDKKEKTTANEQKEKEQKWAAQAEREKQPVEEEPEEKEIKFPHGGKHAPPPGLAKLPDNLRNGKLKQLTEPDGAEALYLTHAAPEVIAIEEEAMTNGLTLHDNFTIIYAFANPIGADGGELTRFIRCEGFHHGHPMRREGETSFNDYMRTEVQKANGNPQRLETLRAFLQKVNVPAGPFGL